MKVIIEEEILRDIDNLLANLEDFVHGKHGEAITRARAEIVKYAPLPETKSGSHDLYGSSADY